MECYLFVAKDEIQVMVNQKSLRGNG